MSETVRDAYPSRVEAEPRVTPRACPVVYPSERSGPLEPRVLSRYEHDGYLVFDTMFSAAEVEQLSSVVSALRASPDILQRPEVIREPGGDGVRSIFRVHELDQEMARLVRDPRLVELASQILGSDVYIHQSRVNFKPAFVGKEFYWHSDFETWHVEDGLPRMRALSISINLTDSTDLNGPLMVIPGSHRSFVACVGETPENHYQESLRRQQYGVPDPRVLTELAQTGIVTAKGKAGSVVLFDCNAMHGSNSNITPFPRCSLFIVYNSVENTPQRPYGGRPPRPEFIASRDTAPLTPGG